MNFAAILFENVIQGIQTLIWILLLTFTFLDYNWIDINFIEKNIAFFSVLAIAVIYFLGLLVDTAYYNLIIQRWERKWVKLFVTIPNQSLQSMYFKCITQNSDLYRLFSERQSHLRLFRVSVVNILLLTITSIVFLYFRLHVQSLKFYIYIILFGMISFTFTCFAWKKLYKYYVSIIEAGFKSITK